MQERSNNVQVHTTAVEAHAQINFGRVNIVVPEQLQTLVDAGKIGVGVDVGTDGRDYRVPGPVDIISHEVKLRQSVQ